MSKVIKTAVVNTKGGSTKSTTAVNLAAAGALAGKRVLLVDFDRQGTSTSMSRIWYRDDINAEEHSSWQIFKGKSPSDLAVTTEFGYDIIPSSGNLIHAEDLIRDTTFGDGLLAKAFAADRNIDHKYDLIICDTEGAASRLVRATLIMCGEYVIPNYPSEGSVEQLDTVVSIVNGINENLFPGIPHIELRAHFFGRAKKNEIIFQLQDEAVTSFFGDLHLSDYSIPETTKFEQAAYNREPILMFEKDGKAATAYSRLFQRLFSELF